MQQDRIDFSKIYFTNLEIVGTTSRPTISDSHRLYEICESNQMTNLRHTVILNLDLRILTTGRWILQSDKSASGHSTASSGWMELHLRICLGASEFGVMHTIYNPHYKKDLGKNKFYYQSIWVRPPKDEEQEVVYNRKMRATWRQCWDRPQGACARAGGRH